MMLKSVSKWFIARSCSTATIESHYQPFIAIINQYPLLNKLPSVVGNDDWLQSTVFSHHWSSFTSTIPVPRVNDNSKGIMRNQKKSTYTSEPSHSGMWVCSRKSNRPVAQKRVLVSTMNLPRVVPPCPWTLDELKSELISLYPVLATEEGLIWRLKCLY